MFVNSGPDAASGLDGKSAGAITVEDIGLDISDVIGCMTVNDDAFLVLQALKAIPHTSVSVGTLTLTLNNITPFHLTFLPASNHDKPHISPTVSSTGNIVY
jgi:hypothetical protein